MLEEPTLNVEFRFLHLRIGFLLRLVFQIFEFDDD